MKTQRSIGRLHLKERVLCLPHQINLPIVSMFIRAIEKCATNMEDLIQFYCGSVDESFHKDLEELLSYIHVQLATISSTERVLEMITEASMTMACNFELARRDTILKFSAPQLHQRTCFHPQY